MRYSLFGVAVIVGITGGASPAAAAGLLNTTAAIGRHVHMTLDEKVGDWPRRHYRRYGYAAPPAYGYYPPAYSYYPPAYLPPSFGYYDAYGYYRRPYFATPWF
jgi:hypothetical protein